MSKILADQGTPELSRHHKVKPELVSMKTGHAVRLRVVDQIILDRMLMRDLISKDQFDTGNSFRADLFRAGLTGPATSKYMPRAQLEPVMLGDRRADGLLKVGEALRELDRACGRLTRQAIVDLCLDLSEPQPQQACAGLDVLRAFLDRWRVDG